MWGVCECTILAVGRLDVEDLARSAVYSGGYNPEHPTVKALWEAVGEFSEEDQRSFLRFVTACPNTPLLGFSQLAGGGGRRPPHSSTALVF